MPKDLLVFERASKQRPSARKNSEGLLTLSCKISIVKLMEVQTRAVDRSKSQAQRVSISGTKSS